MSQASEPKYQLVKDYIVEYIQKGDLKHNDRIFSELELMERFGVSRHTVRKAIGDLENEGWLYKQQGKGTFVSDPYANTKNSGKLIAVVTTYLKDYIFPEIIGGIEKVFTDAGYSILLGNTNNKIEKERQVLTNLLNNNLDGLIIEPTKSVFPNHNKDLFQKIAERGIPIVNIHATYSNMPSSYVIEDDALAGAIATEHLISLGHQKIAGIFKNDDAQGHGRYEGFVSSLRKHQLPLEEDAIIWFNTEDRSQVLSEKNLNTLVKKVKGCTAIVCYNDEVAIKLLSMFKSVDILVPRDLSVVSFDNAYLAQNSEFKLTTVAHPKSLLGERAAHALLELIAQPGKQIQEVMKPTLIVRESTQILTRL